jgi:hypothetical protein
MQNKLDSLESQLQETRSKISRDAFDQWLRSKSTKCLLLQLAIDSEDLKDNWSKGSFSEEESIKAQGQTQYIDGISELIYEIGPSDA